MQQMLHAGNAPLPSAANKKSFFLFTLHQMLTIRKAPAQIKSLHVYKFLYCKYQIRDIIIETPT